MTATRTVTTIDELREHIGQDLGHGPWLEITQELVDQFGALSGYDGWVHCDPERAATSSFGGTIAQGYLILSMESRLGRDWQGVAQNLGQRVSLNYGLNKVRFPNPVRVGARVRLCSRLIGIEDVAPTTYHITVGLTVEIEGQSKPAMVAERIRRVVL